MNIFVFLGPTLSIAEASRRLPAVYLPPAAQGDVYRAARERPFAIGIVDGYFERLPAVWHKEILWAMAQGIHVFGAASMGALRAAELAAFGMVGVGKIFDAYRSGELEDDDEVAVAHGDASAGYRMTSEAMVNVRATLLAAERAGTIGADLRGELVGLAKALFYPDRSYPRLFALALERGAAIDDIDALRSFVTARRVDQKREDALALLDAISTCRDVGGPPPPARFAFAHTEAWSNAVDWAENQPPLVDCEGSAADLLGAEVRLSGSRALEVLAKGWSRTLAGALARQRSVPDRSARVATLHRATRERHGNEDSTFQSWLDAQGLTQETYEAFLERQVDLEWAQECFRDEVNRHLVDELRARGEYARLAGQAQDKHRTLAERGLTHPALSDAGVTESELLAWYFAKLGRSVPDELDRDRVATELGIADFASLQREAIRALLYSRLSPSSR